MNLEPIREIGKEHAFFSTGETLGSVFYLKNTLLMPGEMHTYFFP
jgi:hypothetical protein